MDKIVRLFFAVTFLFAGLLRADAQPLISYSPVISSGLSSPVDIVNAGDGTNRIFIVQRGGTIRVYNGSTFAFLGTFLTLSGNFTTGGERGLLSLAFHPDYETNGYFFVYYTNGAGGVNVDRFQVSAGDPNVANASSRTNIMTFTKPVVYGNHNGGDLNFGPDGNLYFALGDSGSSGDPGDLAQNGNSYWGKMIRINVNNFTTPPYYTVPADNPYISNPNVLDEIWALGLRNPWRWSFDRLNGDMWIGDVGQNVLEEVNWVPAAGTGAKNYGWRCYEGFAPFNTAGCQAQSSYTPPIFDYPHNNTTGGFSITGGFVYRGAEFSFLNGYYICVDYVSGNLWLIRSNGSGGWTTSIQTGLTTSISTFGEAENGTLYAAALGGTVFKVNATAPIPVTLTRFTARRSGGGVLVQWQTSFEQQTNRFEVEYNTGGAWQKAGELPASGLSGGGSYSFVHNFSSNGAVQYRLKIIDNNGSFTYSPIAALDGGGKKALVFPTLVQDGVLRIALDAPFISLQLLDAGGREVYRANITGRTGYQQLPLPPLQSGIYTVAVKNAQEIITQKLVLQ